MIHVNYNLKGISKATDHNVVMLIAQVTWPMAFESGNPTDVMFMEVSCYFHLKENTDG